MRRITTANAGESALAKWEHEGLSVTRLPDDPICPRISLGGIVHTLKQVVCVKG